MKHNIIKNEYMQKVDSKLFAGHGTNHNNSQYKSVKRVFLCVPMLFGALFFLSAHAATNIESSPKNMQKQAKIESQTESKPAQKNVAIRGNTLVIEDASCQPHNKTLLSSLQGDSGQTSLQDCDDIHK